MAMVLVIDDEYGVAEVVEAILEDDGHTVVCAVNGRQGLDRLVEDRPDVVLLDFMMPIMDGPATLRAMKTDPTLAGIPVVMMSSLAEGTVRAECDGYVAFLRKPFRAAALSQAVTDVLRGIAAA